MRRGYFLPIILPFSLGTQSYPSELVPPFLDQSYAPAKILPKPTDIVGMGNHWPISHWNSETWRWNWRWNTQHQQPGAEPPLHRDWETTFGWVTVSDIWRWTVLCSADRNWFTSTTGDCHNTHTVTYTQTISTSIKPLRSHRFGLSYLVRICAVLTVVVE